MPRAERPLDGGDGPLLWFAADLRQLRMRAGSPAYRELSRRAHYSAASLSDAAGGRKLPSLAVTLAYVAACGGDTAAWEQRWRATAADVAGPTATQQSTNGDSGPAPYVGLAAFQPEDADRFFGREHLVAQLAALVARQRFVVVIGPSGSGKSSLLRAGLVHHARSQGPLLIMAPGPHPLEDCAARLAALTRTPANSVHEGLRTDSRSLHLAALQALSDQPPDAELLLVVDQFEEIFTLCQDTDERIQFLQVLRSAADASNSRTRIVLGVRSDFYGHCTHHPELIDVLRDAQVPVGPMSTEELRSAITQPALNAGLRVETGLVSQVIADTTGQPGVLPLVSHALLETWRRRHGTTLTLVGYVATGGITESIARTAETVYAALSERQQQWARQLFIRLVALGEGTEDTKRRLHRAELELDGHPANVAVVERLAQARLLTLDRDSVEISHEALVRRWPRLHEWLTRDREGVRVHRQLTEAASIWESLRHDPGALYRGSRLTLADQWATTSEDGMLTTREREFLRASLAVRTAEQTAVRCRTRRLRNLLVLLAVLLVIATGATGFAMQAQHTADDQRNRAIAENVLSQATALTATDSALAWQLGLAAYRLAPLPDVRSALLTMMTAPFTTRLTEPGQLIESVAFTPNNHLLATSDFNGSAPAGLASSGGDVRLWDFSDAAHPRELGRLAGLTGLVTDVAFSPDGRTLATAGIDAAHRRILRLWDVSDPGHPRGTASLAGSRGQINSVAFSPDGRTVATAGLTSVIGASTTAPTFDNEVALWDIADPRAPRELTALTGSSTEPAIAAFSPAGHLLATGGVTDGSAPETPAEGNEVRLWDVGDPRHPEPTATLTGSAGAVFALTFRPDGRVLATSDVTTVHATAQFGDGDEVRLWNLSDPRHPEAATTITGTNPSAHQAAAFSSDNHTLATINSNNTIRLWDITDPGKPRELVTLTGSPDVLNGLTFSADGHTLADLSAGTIRLQDVTNYVLPVRADGMLGSVAVSPDGRVLAVGHDSTVDLFDITDPYRRRSLASFAVADTHAFVASVRFGPGGRTLAVDSLGNGGNALTLWDVADPAHPWELTTGVSATIVANSLDFSPRRHLLATGDITAGTIRLWDVGDPRLPRQLASVAVPGVVFRALAFAPDGRTLAAVGSDGVIRFWDVTDPGRPRLSGSPIRSTTSTVSVLFSPDGHVLAAGDSDGTVTLWDVTDARHPQRDATLTMALGSVWVTYRPDGHVLAAGNADGTVTLWDVTDPHHPQREATLTTSASTGSLAFSPDNHTLAVAGDDYPQLLETDAERAASHICEVAWPAITVSEWDHYFPGIAYQPPCTQGHDQ